MCGINFHLDYEEHAGLCRDAANDYGSRLDTGISSSSCMEMCTRNADCVAASWFSGGAEPIGDCYRISSMVRADGNAKWTCFKKQDSGKIIFYAY